MTFRESKRFSFSTSQLSEDTSPGKKSPTSGEKKGFFRTLTNHFRKSRKLAKSENFEYDGAISNSEPSSPSQIKTDSMLILTDSNDKIDQNSSVDQSESDQSLADQAVLDLLKEMKKKDQHRRSKSLQDDEVKSSMSGSLPNILEGIKEEESTIYRPKASTPKGKIQYYSLGRREKEKNEEKEKSKEKEKIEITETRERSYTLQGAKIVRPVKLKKEPGFNSIENLKPRDIGFVEKEVEFSRTELDGTGQVNQYVIIREIGRGSYGSVKEVQNLDDGKRYAMKVISKKRLRRLNQKSRTIQRGPRAVSTENLVDNNNEEIEEIKHEIAILKKISRHPYFVQLVEFLYDNQEEFVYMVLELCENGPIMKPISGKEVPHYNEQEAHKYFRQLILAVEYLHLNKIIHRDIKPENILLNQNGDVQLSDFGVSHMFDGEDDWLNASSGSPAFSPPEVCSPGVRKFHGKAVDIWAIGVTLYCLLFGRCPFEAPIIPALYKKIIHDQVAFPKKINSYLQDLILKMLEKDPEKRITLEDIRVHTWVTQAGTNPLPTVSQNIEVTADDVKLAVKRAKSKRLSKMKNGLYVPAGRGLRDKSLSRYRSSETISTNEKLPSPVLNTIQDV